MSDVLARLSDALGDSVTTDGTVLASAQADKSGHRSGSAPLAVVNARSIRDVQETMRIAHDTGTPVVTRGAGTGLAGGAIGSGGEIVLSTRSMDAVLEIRPDDLLAVVQPGILNARFNEILADQGLWFAPDPASKAISTVGGNIATNAGGLLCAKYGVTRDAVLGLTVVLADGSVIETGHRSVKGVTGLDLTALMVGSEGLLGVIVEATVRVRRAVPGTPATIASFYDGVKDAAAAAAAITAAGLQPAVMELLDPTVLRAVDTYHGSDLASRGNAHLAVQFDGPGAAADAHRALEIVRAHATDADLTTDRAASDDLLAARRDAHPAIETLGTSLIEDVSVPRSAMPAMFDRIAQIETAYGITIPTLAHAGDGNLHPNFVFDGDDVPEYVWEAAGELFQAALELGGTLTGEHGIGTLKKRWLGDEVGERQLQLQRGIKSVFDPTGILNPGKVL